MTCTCMWASPRHVCMCEQDGCWEKTRIGGIPCAACSCRAEPAGPFYGDELKLIRQVVLKRQIQRHYVKDHKRRHEIEQEIFALFEKIEEVREPKKLAARIARRLEA